ncbi:sensor histidine kinase [Nodularia spumigena]|nr:PAS domain-containing sensor histidine kinase [Nodularia spumigena]MEA5527237.1 PAS domain-containing sensor histidine kinase [Nodularia spumigena UHCC 0143]
MEITFTYIDEQSRKVDCSFGCERNDEVVEGCMYKWIDELQNTQKHLQQEIAELKEKEAQIQQSLSLLRSTLESTAHGIVTVSLKGDILGFNQKFVDMWHIPNSLMLSRNYLQCQAFFEKELKYPEAYNQVMREISNQFDLESYDILELKDGRIFAQYSQPQWLEGKIMGRLWSIWDITESQRTEEVPQLNEASWCTLAETTNASIFIIQGWDLSYMNPAAEVLTGYTKEELITGFDARQLFKNKKRKQVHDKDLEYQEIKILEKNGTERWLACAVAMLDDQETPFEMIAGIDITEYKQAESDLSQTLEQIKQLSELKAQFMSMVCHQFRTPLNVVSFSNSLLKRHINYCQEEKTGPLLDHIQSGVEQITKMLDDILFFAKAEAAKLNFDAKPLNLVEFCNELIAQMQTNGSENRINFVSQGRYITACMDQKLLEPMISNLLDNAMKYSPIGSVVDFKLFCECGKVVFQVTDRGIGIPVADIPRLFEPFYRGSNIHHLPGTGLGLSIVKTLVDLHRGYIAVESELGVSTTFTMMLPAVKSKL